MKKLIFLVIFLPVLLHAQKNYSTQLDKYMQGQVGVNDFSGTVLVAQKGKVIYEKAFGMANREWNIPNTLQTKFRIGSLTKEFTAAGIMQLVEKGNLSLDDKLSKFFPGFPRADSVTIHMLLNHTSGIRSYTNLPIFPSIVTLPYTKDSVVALVSREPYDFNPGTEYRYSNSGYFLLGYIIEKASGQPYSTYIYDNVIRKAGLKNTAVNQLDSILAYRASGYIRTPRGIKNAGYISMEFPFSAGAIISTTEDLYQWSNALFGGKIVSAPLFTKMSTPYLNKYGYGLHIDSLGNHKHIGHSGGIPGFTTNNEWYPADEVCIIVLSNNESQSTSIGQGLAAILFDIPVTIPYKHLEARIDPAQLDKYVGKYQLPNNTYVELVKKNDKLYRKMPNARELELKPESQSRFFHSNGMDILLDFTLDQKGNVTRASQITYGYANEMKKVN